MVHRIRSRRPFIVPLLLILLLQLAFAPFHDGVVHAKAGSPAASAAAASSGRCSSSSHIRRLESCSSEDKEHAFQGPLRTHSRLPMMGLQQQRGGSISTRNKLANFQQRAIPAVLLLALFYGIVRQFQEKGLTVLLMLVSPILYQEATGVLRSHPTLALGHDTFTSRWWWFVSYSLALTMPKAAHILFDDVAATNDNHQWLLRYRPKLPHYCHLLSYVMIAVGFVQWIVRLNTVPSDTETTTASGQFLSAWNEMALFHLGAFFTIIPVSFWMQVLREFGWRWAVYTALLVILNDTMAYVFGILMGKTAILPTISPKKTWEGWIGALVTTMLLSWPLFSILLADGTNHFDAHAFCIALFCCIVAPFGGFLASSIKRAGHKKDFSNVISGHGGLVDRLDCQLFAAPFLYLYLKAVETS